MTKNTPADKVRFMLAAAKGLHPKKYIFTIKYYLI